MKLIRYTDQTNSIDSRVHMIVTRDTDSKDVAELIAVGLVDVDSAARAMVARFLKGDRTILYNGPAAKIVESKIHAQKYMHRFVSRPIGKLTHAIVVHKSAVDETLPEGTPRILLSPNGESVESLFLRRFSTDFNLPYVEAWKDAIWNECWSRKLVKNLNVWTDPNVQFWQNLKAFETSAQLTEELAKEILSRLLSQKVIELPEGLTEAPNLDDTLVQDEETGEYSVTDYLQTYASHLATSIEELATPAHDLDQPINPAIADMGRSPFPSQAHTAQAVLKGYESSKGAIVASDMGCGKSIVALAIANALAKRSQKGFVAALLVPGITVPKWIRDEIGKTLPEAKITNLENWRDLVRYRNERVVTGQKEGIEFLLLSRDTAKLGMPKTVALIHKQQVVYADRSGYNAPSKPKIRTDANGTKITVGTADKARSVFKVEDVWVCPECGGIQKKTDKTSLQNAKKHNEESGRIHELKLGFYDLATDKTVTQISSKKNHVQYKFCKSVTEYKCSECGVNLMRNAVPEREAASGLKHRRLQPAWFIQRYMRGWIDLAVVDELHQYRNLSGQGESMGTIVGASKRCLGLTGTLSDGTASSMFHLLWRICPSQMKADGMDHRSLSKFVHRYGVMEQKGRYSRDEIASAGGNTSRKLIMNPPKEVPGLSPRLFVTFLADKCVFLELGDLGLPLVELDERPVFVDMEGDHQSNYSFFHNGLETTMKQQYMSGNKSAFARFIPSTVNAANQPHISQTVILGDDCVTFDAPNTEFQLSAKEQKIVDDIRQELSENRRCYVYVRYSGDAQQDRRLYDILKREGIRVQVMQASVSPEERIEWLENAVNKGVEVVISNVKLVECGVDLMWFPTLMFYQFIDEVNVMRQASRRSWRIAQYRMCKVYYYMYNRSYEMAQFKRMLTKRSHALLLEGRLSKSEVDTFAEKDSKSASTFAIANCLGNISDLTQKWKTLADKDIPAGVTMLAEEKFKVELGLAMKRLSAETRRLAGLPEANESLPAVSAPAETTVNVPKAAPRAAVLPLFDSFNASIQAPVQTSAPASDENPLTVGDMRKRMGLVIKAKRAKNQIHDNQVALFAFDAV